MGLSGFPGTSMPGSSKTDSPTATRYGFRLVAQCAANNYWDLFSFRPQDCLPSGGNTTTPNRAV